VKILAIETSGPHCSVALLCNGELISDHRLAPRRHGELLLPMMEDMLAGAGVALPELDALAFGRGPGSFTGVRIAAAVAQGAAFGAGIPLLGISTLAALAHAAWRHHGRATLLAAVDARMGELYWGVFRVTGPGQVLALQAEAVSAPEQVALTVATWPSADSPDRSAGLEPELAPVLDLGVGDGWRLYGETLRARIGPHWKQPWKEQGNQAEMPVDAELGCTAADVAELAAVAFAAGAALAPELGLPVYLRDQVAIKPGSR
jgi:tRNA threonylcarbamoyladenosine biosynthesis protein TsaB